MADTIEYGVKLTGDGSVLVGSMRVTREESDKLKQSLKQTGDAVEKVGQQSSVAAEFMKGFAGAFTIAAIAQWTDATVHAAATLVDLSQITGSSIENLSRLSNVAIVSGQGTDKLRTGIERLNYALTNQDEASTRAQKSLAALGITSKDPAEALQQLADKLDTYADGNKKATLVQDILGKGMQELIPLLKELATSGDVGRIRRSSMS